MPSADAISLRIQPGASPRVQYGVQRLSAALKSIGETVELTDQIAGSPRQMFVGVQKRPIPAHAQELKPEGFAISCERGQVASVLGHDESGAIYGCLELAGRIAAAGKLPDQLRVVDAPQFVLRGPAIGMQKTFILPGRKVYEYPYTPELFPFFYDQQHWIELLDRLADLRFNTLYIWAGHPFASLVRLADYPYAVEVSDDQLTRNARMFRWIATEADRRGVWLVQNSYSILLPKPLAERHGLETQLAAPHPVAADYTRKSVAAFVKEFPNVGLMFCLGEALSGIENQRHWLNDVLLPGVHDGMKLAGLHDEPPVILRTHATDATQIVPDALKVYRNLYTEAKFNGESLTTWEPRGVRQQLHQAMSRLGSTHVINVHILANLEPFRYAAQRFIQHSMHAARDRLGGRGLHLYPLAFWDWPVAPDATDPLLRQIDRDWMWYEAWARYAWNADVPAGVDSEYWIDRLADRYGNTEAAGLILAALNDIGECAPRLLRRYGITEGNRQTLSLGMTLDQLVSPDKYRPFPELWESQSPPGERLGEFVDRQVHRQPHQGETPPQINAEVLEFSAHAVESIDSAAKLVTKDLHEFARLRNDVHCIRAMSQCYVAKTTAAMHVLRYRRTGDKAQMRSAAAALEESLSHFRDLARLAGPAYRYANSMQTNQRKIPVSGGIDGKAVNFHWDQLLGIYETELVEFRKTVDAIELGGSTDPDESEITALPRGRFKVLSKGAETYEVQVGAGVFTDRQWVIQSLAPELQTLMGMRFSHESAVAGKYQPIEFEAVEPVRVLIGFVKGDPGTWLKPADLETDAYADDRGGAEPIVVNAAAITGLPPVDVHAFSFDKGQNRLEMKGKGSFVVLGVVPATAALPRRDANRGGGSRP